MFAHAVIWVPIAAIVAVLMDVWAGLLHGGLWHRSLWGVHRSHHQPRVGRFELNDAFALVHAPPAMVLILYGCIAPESVHREVLYGIGIGMTAFAVGYGVVHDGLVHGRLPVSGLMKVGFLRRVVKAHRIHHTLPAGKPYSLFFGPTELRIANRLRQRAASSRPGAPRRPTAPGDRSRAPS